MTFNFNESSADRFDPATLRDVEAYVADSWKLHPR